MRKKTPTPMTGPKRVARIIINNGFAVMTQTPHNAASMPHRPQPTGYIHLGRPSPPSADLIRIHLIKVDCIQNLHDFRVRRATEASLSKMLR
jgi:hypothetical protein